MGDIWSLLVSLPFPPFEHKILYTY